VMVRVHSSSMIGDVFGSEHFGRGEQLHRAMEMIEEEGKGVIVYINKSSHSNSPIDELKAYQALNEENTSSNGAAAPAKMDTKDYGIGAQILRKLGVSKMKLMSNNPKKRIGIVGYGLEIVDNLPIALTPQTEEQ
jgi:3,4-dihydroxy 2-butanone 4-phosphate synthase/GTP cyclohydrolase II